MMNLHFAPPNYYPSAMPMWGWWLFLGVNTGLLVVFVIGVLRRR